MILVTADTEPSAQRVETKTSGGEPSIYSPSVNEIDPCQNTTRQTTEKSEENIFNKTLVTNDLPVQTSGENQMSLQTLLNHLQISKDAAEEPQSRFQTQSSLELHNVYEEEEIVEEKASVISSQQYRSKSSQAKSCIHIVPSSMNPSELESLYDKLESPTSEDKMRAECQVQGSRSIENILSSEKNVKKQQSHKKNKKSGEFNLPLQQSNSGKKSNNASLSVGRGNNRGFNENFARLLKNKARDGQDLNVSQTESDMMHTEIDDYDNIENQRLSLHIKMATRDNLATPPQYSARLPSARLGNTLDSSRLRTQQCEKSMLKTGSALTRLERDYLADMDRKKRLAELVAQSTKNQTRKTVQNRSMIKKAVPEKKEERIVMKSKMPTRRESHVDVAEIKRDVSAEKSAIIIDRPLQMKPKKEEINLEVINTLRLKRQNPDNVLFKKSQSKSVTKKRFGNNTDRINFNETILLNKSQDLGRSFVEPKRLGKNSTQEAAAQKPSIGEAKGWSNTLDAVMSGITVGGVSKTWESLTRKISTTVNNNEVVVNLQEEKELLAEYASQAKIAAESTDILTKRSNNSDIEEMITSQFNIKGIKLDSLAFLLLRQSEEKVGILKSFEVV